MTVTLEDLFVKDNPFPSFLMPKELATVAELNKHYRDVIYAAEKMWKKCTFEVFQMDKKLPDSTWRRTFAHLWRQDLKLRRENEEEAKQEDDV
jgi:hypothetical protein